jgi:hypothetical protein
MVGREMSGNCETGLSVRSVYRTTLRTSRLGDLPGTSIARPAARACRKPCRGARARRTSTHRGGYIADQWRDRESGRPARHLPYDPLGKMRRLGLRDSSRTAETDQGSLPGAKQRITVSLPTDVHQTTAWPVGLGLPSGSRSAVSGTIRQEELIQTSYWPLDARQSDSARM